MYKLSIVKEYFQSSFLSSPTVLELSSQRRLATSSWLADLKGCFGAQSLQQGKTEVMINHCQY